MLSQYKSVPMVLQAIGQFTLAGLPQATLVAAGFAALALVVPPVSMLAGAAVALVTLRQGVKPAVLVAVAATLLLALSAMFMQQTAMLGLVYGAAQWAPVIGLAWLLRRSVSWSATLQAAAIVGLIGVVAMHLLVPDTAAFWQQKMEKLFEPMLEQAGDGAPAIVDGLVGVSRHLTGILFASMVLSTLLTVMLARSIQARLFNPGGFRGEFNELRVGRWLALAGIVVIAMALVFPSQLARDLALVLVAVYFLQGLAVIHNLGARFQWPRGWMFGLYVMLILFLWPLAMLLAGLGLIDAFADFRARAHQT